MIHSQTEMIMKLCETEFKLQISIRIWESEFRMIENYELVAFYSTASSFIGTIYLKMDLRDC